MPSSGDSCFDPVTAPGRSQACCPASRNVAMAEHDREADVDGAPRGGKPSTDALMAEQCDEADVDGAKPRGGNPQMLFCLLSLRACHWQLHCFRSRKTCLFGGTLLVNVRRTIWSMLPVSYLKECSPVYTVMVFRRYRDVLVQQVDSKRPLLYQPLVPYILTACPATKLCCHSVTLASDRQWCEISTCAALFLWVRTTHSNLIQKHPRSRISARLDTKRPFPSSLLTLELTTSATLELNNKHEPPASTSITTRHVQALRADLRETLREAKHQVLPSTRCGQSSHTDQTDLGEW